MGPLARDGYGLGSDPEHHRQLLRLAGCTERVLHTDELDRARPGLCQRFGDRAAQPAVDIVILGGDNGAGLFGAAREKVLRPLVHEVPTEMREADEVGRGLARRHLRREVKLVFFLLCANRIKRSESNPL